MSEETQKPQEAINFYDVATRQFVSVPVADVKKTSYQKEGSKARYAVRATTSDGRNLTKFISKTHYDELNVPVVE